MPTTFRDVWLFEATCIYSNRTPMLFPVGVVYALASPARRASDTSRTCPWHFGRLLTFWDASTRHRYKEEGCRTCSGADRWNQLRDACSRARGAMTAADETGLMFFKMEWLGSPSETNADVKFTMKIYSAISAPLVEPNGTAEIT